MRQWLHQRRKPVTFGKRERTVTSYLNELFAHQEWADAEHWRAFEAHPTALEDKAIRERLVHIHLVQHAFLWITGPRTAQFAVKKPEDFPQIADLKAYARQGLAELNDKVQAATPEQLEEVIEISWSKPPFKISRRQALTQAAMHSHYHRGQNATRLRELGGTPPTTDYILWLREGQPGARWH
jgi:uncharacterized damage-inducible protein DinB